MNRVFKKIKERFSPWKTTTRTSRTTSIIISRTIRTTRISRTTRTSRIRRTETISEAKRIEGCGNSPPFILYSSYDFLNNNADTKA